MARQSLVVVTGPALQSSQILSGCVTQAPVAGAAVLPTDATHVKMPVYQFAVKWDADQTPDVRYTHLADEEAARRYAKLLIHELAPSGFYSSRSCFLEVKDETGSLLFSIPFREIAADK